MSACPALRDDGTPAAPAAATRSLLKVLIVEDEPGARNRLCRLLSPLAGIEVAAVCGDGDAALEVLAAERVDIAVLDIAVPGADGMLLGARALSLGIVCVFTTASCERAVDAFAIEAADFLVKPFSGERLLQAMHRAQKRVVAGTALRLTDQLRSLLDSATSMERPSAGLSGPEPAPGAGPGYGRFLVRNDGRMTLVRESQIEWIEADGKSTLLHLGGRVLRAADSFSSVLSNVSDSLFLQVNRSAAINTDRIREVHELFKGNVSIAMNCGTEIPVSRRFRTQVLARLGARV